jgi:sulfatase maturation enzyme AslB (radical SAM superfamily)
MIFFENDLSFSFDTDTSETPNKEWIEKLGVYGTHHGFTEISAFPRVDTALMETKISNYKACNTECDYCLEKYFVENFDLHPYPKLNHTFDSILKYKPSTVEITGGELLQKNNISVIDKTMKFLDQIDPKKKIKLETISNGKDTETIIKYFKDPRVYVTLSFDPSTIGNYRHVDVNQAFTTIEQMAAIDTSRFHVAWMVSVNHPIDDTRTFLDKMAELNVNYNIQPINEVVGFFENGETYELQTIEKIIELFPEFVEQYPPNKLIMPRISCFDGAVVIKSDNQVATCNFRPASKDYPEYETILTDTRDLTVSAGVCHVCSIDTGQTNRPSNYNQIQRLAYTLIGYNLKEKYKDNLEAVVQDYKVLYNYMIDFKKELYSVKNNTGEYKVVCEVCFPNAQLSYMTLVRLLEKINIKVKDINDSSNELQDDQWIRYTNGEDVTVLTYEKYIANTDQFSSKDVLAVYTYNNFPTRLWFMGRHEHLEGALLDNKEYIYPNVMQNAPNMISKIPKFLSGDVI